MNVKQKLISTLTPFGYPVFLQGTLAADAQYPASFITFFTTTTDENEHFENAVHSVDWFISVMFYSDNAELVNTVPQQIISALRNAGFIPQGEGNDIPSDIETHTGWAMDFIYKKEKEF